MPVVFCSGCNTKLSLGQNVAAAFVKCPRCGGRVATGGGVQPPAVQVAAPASRAPATPRHAPPPPPPPTPVEAEEILDAEEAPRRRKKKKRRRSYHEEERSSGKPLWFWGVLGGTGLVTLAGLAVAVYFTIQSGFVFDIVKYGITLAISVPVSVVIFLISVFLSNAMGIGIDLGEAHIAIGKAAILLLVVNIIDAIPLPWIFLWGVIPVWIIGLITLFDIDMWEARFLILINIVLNAIFTLFILGIILALVQGGRLGGTNTDYDEYPDLSRLSERDKEQIQREADEREESFRKHQAALRKAEDRVRELGGEIFRDAEDRQVRGVMFPNNQRVTDADMKVIAAFTTLKSIDITGTSVTDKGLVHLKGLVELQMILIGRTKITEAGVKELQKSLPLVQVSHRG